MADGAVDRTITVTLDAATADRLEQVAQNAGLPTETYVGDLIADSLITGSGIDGLTARAVRFQRTQTKLALAEYKRTGVSIPVEDVLADVRAELEARLAAKA